MKRIFIMLSLLLTGLSLQAQDYGLSFQEVDSLMKVAPKPILVFLHADWCKYCQGMKKTTFQDEKVKTKLKSDFYFISFNGESKEDVVFSGHRFRYQPSGAGTGEHQLAKQLGEVDGELAYPTLVVLNDKYEIIGQWNSFLSGKRLGRILAKH
ncbi:MAG: thioredoxin family protein [Bacteroidia bacterium]|nr:thioredoxin family protein [Bacteroidia bacterium]